MALLLLLVQIIIMGCAHGEHQACTTNECMPGASTFDATSSPLQSQAKAKPGVARELVLLQRTYVRSTDLQTANHSSCQVKTLDTRWGPRGHPNMAQCQGDCDSDADCAGDLKCFQRDQYEAVPGCTGYGLPDFDFCYDPQCAGDLLPAPGGLPALDSSPGRYGRVDMAQCQGDCDSDSDCASGLRCFQRQSLESVPGCQGVGVVEFDYCYDPQDEEPSTTLPPAPTVPVLTSTLTPTPGAEKCLCVFDIDRTLTGRQGSAGRSGYCPGNVEVPGVADEAYSGGVLTLSTMGIPGALAQTFCDACFLGVVSAGFASGENSAERAFLASKVLVSKAHDALVRQTSQASAWSYYKNVVSPFVLGQPDRTKHYAVERILGWYSNQGITIPPAKVHFFGDRTENIVAFQSRGFNAREISCGSRDTSMNGMVGLCGGRVEEIVDTPGVATCW
ncbi:unnamed protein product [Polarella glacialis]|uniref:Uncharacterized protein n=1 Tax=Polarella glacialis TaxID=89957 RepID=A0A813JJ29_POLGL|nr:unnamed protein product [Polarella glacialis]